MHDSPETQIRGKVVLPVIYANHQTSDVNMNSEETMIQLPTLRYLSIFFHGKHYENGCLCDQTDHPIIEERSGFLNNRFMVTDIELMNVILHFLCLPSFLFDYLSNWTLEVASQCWKRALWRQHRKLSIRRESNI